MQHQCMTIIIAAAFLVLEIGCGQNGKPKGRSRGDQIDGGYVMRDECDAPIVDCGDKCHAREASAACYGCCLDQGALCNTNQPYSMEYCDGAR